MLRSFWETGARTARRVGVAVVGAVVLAGGVVLLVLPGPGVLVIPLGLGILALEFAWARHWLERVRERSDDALERLRALRSSGSQDTA